MDNIFRQISIIILKHSPFVNIWSDVLVTNAKIYMGLYSALQSVSRGTSKKPGSVIKEWCLRTEYQFPNSKVSDICRNKILPLAEKNDKKGCKKTAFRLLIAARNADILCFEKGEMVLSEKNANAYIDLNGNELFVDDKIEVVSPAWYQKEIIIEKGYCNLIH